MSENIEKHHVPYILNGELYEIVSQIGKAVTVRCLNCPQNKIYRGCIQSTGNFHMHIKRKHPEYLDRLNELKMESITSRQQSVPKKHKPRKPTKHKFQHKVMPPSEENILPALSASINAPLDLSMKRISTVNDAENVIPKMSPIQDNLVSRVETTLKGIERELRSRNLLENNRIYLELAKFKYLNPGFQYNTLNLIQ